MAQAKILWLCTFSNEEKRSHLSLWRDRKGGEVGQWIPNLLTGFEADSRYELHVVSGEGWMRRGTESWTSKGIAYHCFQPGLPGLGYSFRLPFEAATGFTFNRRHIRRIIEHVKPDLINLFGAENPQYASAMLDVDARTPVLVTIQGFIHRELSFHPSYLTRVRCRYEEALIKRYHHFTGDYEAEDVVRGFNPFIQSYAPFYFPVNESLVVQTEPQSIKYDILFAGALTRAKGFGDYLEIVRLLKQVQPGIQAAVVGFADVYEEAVPFIERHGLQANVSWLGRFPAQDGLFKAYRQAKLFIAPTYNDCFASTLRENMLLGTPCVAYRTGGIPFANRDGNENIALVDQGDVKGLFERILRLLNNKQERVEISARAQVFARHEFSIQANVSVLKKAYERLLSAADR
jgi:glycosyltransferase involved in cell wall biosynthesis